MEFGGAADGEISPTIRSAASMAFGQATALARAALVNDPFETWEVSGLLLREGN